MPSKFASMYDEWEQSPTPDPATFLKQIWQILSPQQKEMVQALLQNPVPAVDPTTAGAPMGAPAGAPAAPAAPMAPPAPPSPNLPQ